MSSQGKRGSLKRWIIVLAVLFVAIQLVPYGRDHVNPPVQKEPAWDGPQTREIFFRACKNCHSNETEWPWYSNIAPASWMVQYDVSHARSHFNVSEWGRARNKGDEAADEVRDDEMPPWYYRPLHPEARLSPAEREAFAAGLERTFPEGPRDNGHPDVRGKGNTH
jgi:mono/diheme cytochrome c family protein